MYAPPWFADDDVEGMRRLIREHNFGLLVCAEAAGTIEASHLPFLVEEARLVCHVARGNRLAALAAEGRPMTAIFQGPHAYLSARWYPDPSRQVPTWNYAVVHVHGRPRVLGADELRAAVATLARQHEAGAAAPWSIDELDPARAEGMLRGIVGIELTIERMEGKRKLSQNRTETERLALRKGLEDRAAPGDHELAALMGAATEWRRGDFVISTERARIDLDAVMGFMRQTYWAADEDRARMARAIANCLCFGVYGVAGTLVGFARVITDYATFGYLSDVFIDPAVRGAGIGKWLVDVIYGHPALQGFRRHVLFTRDAHALYQRVGFGPLADPAIAMEKLG